MRGSTPPILPGRRCALPWTLQPWPRTGIEPKLSHPTRIAGLTHSRETSLSLHPSTWAAFLPPRPLTISWRRLHRDQGREHFIATLPMDPSHRPWGMSCPLEPRPGGRRRSPSMDLPSTKLAPLGFAPACRCWTRSLQHLITSELSADIVRRLGHPCPVDKLARGAGRYHALC